MDFKQKKETPNSLIVLEDAQANDDQSQSTPESRIEQPGKIMRIGTMIRQLLEEARQSSLDEPSRQRLKEIYETSLEEIGADLPQELSEELQRLSFSFSSNAPSESELRIAQAQLVGWLEGLFHGIQAALVAQQMTARVQLDGMRRKEAQASFEDVASSRPGTYL